MNRKGFTLIEVIAVIVLLGIIVAVSVPTIITVYDDSKLNAEEIFINHLGKSIDDYVKLNSLFGSFTPMSGNFTKCSKYNDDDSCLETERVSVSKRTEAVTINDVINSGIISADDYKNAGNNKQSCNSLADVEIYKDSDAVTCFKVRSESLSSKKGLDCLSSSYLAKHSGEYAIDTCIWTEE